MFHLVPYRVCGTHLAYRCVSDISYRGRKCNFLHVALEPWALCIQIAWNTQKVLKIVHSTWFCQVYGLEKSWACLNMWSWTKMAKFALFKASLSSGMTPVVHRWSLPCTLDEINKIEHLAPQSRPSMLIFPKESESRAFSALIGLK